MATAPRGDKPDPIKFDLASLDYETPEPLVFAFEGKRYVVENPGATRWSSLDRVADGDIAAMLKIYLGADQYKSLTTSPKFLAMHAGRLIEQIQDHFSGVPEGEDNAS